MDAVFNFFDINQIFFVILGYKMSYIEFFGTLLNFCSVWLAIRNNIWTWPVGNIAVIVFGILFYQIQLYSDLLTQVYFLITGFYGWFIWLYWKRNERPNEKKELAVTLNTQKANSICIAIIFLGTLALGYVMQNIHFYLPNAFPIKAAFPYMDAFIAMMSFTANILMAHKKLECWYLWITLDIFSVGLYCSKNVMFVALLYALFLCLAIKGLLNWRSLMKTDVRKAFDETWNSDREVLSPS